MGSGDTHDGHPGLGSPDNTTLYFSDINLSCDSGSAAIDPESGPGNLDVDDPAETFRHEGTLGMEIPSQDLSLPGSGDG